MLYTVCLVLFSADPVTRGLSIIVDWLGIQVDVSWRHDQNEIPTKGCNYTSISAMLTWLKTTLITSLVFFSRCRLSSGVNTSPSFWLVSLWWRPSEDCSSPSLRYPPPHHLHNLFQCLLSWLLHKWREGYLLPTWARKITCQRFDWMLQSPSGWKEMTTGAFSQNVGELFSKLNSTCYFSLQDAPWRWP